VEGAAASAPPWWQGGWFVIANADLASMRRRRSGALHQRPGASAAVGALLLLLYVLPLYFPPPATVPVAPSAATPFWERVFSGVPTWWVLARLVCLFVGAALIAVPARREIPLALAGGATARQDAARPEPRRGGERLALLLALVQAVLGLFAARFGRLGETAYFAALAIPAALVAWAESTHWRTPWRRWASRVALLLIVPLLWMAICLPAAWRSPRAANLVDMWVLIERLERVARGEQKILSDSTQPGHTNAYMMFEGVPLLGPDRFPVTFVGLQVVHAIAAVTCAAATGAVVWQVVAPAAAPVAQAALLFSPYGLSALYEPAPMFFTAVCASVLMLLLVLVRRYRSRAALVAFGAVAGLSSTDPPIVPIALLLCAAMVASLGRFGRVPRWAFGAAALSGAAAVTPNLPTPAMVMEMVHQYTLGRAQLVAIVNILFGQETPYGVGAALRTGRAGPLDLPVGSLLAPFAIARTPLRIWGDVMFEPLAGALTAVGLLLCLLQARRNRTAFFFLVLLLAGLVGGFTAEGDAVSHTRLAPALIPIVVLAAVGFESVRGSLAARWRPQRVGAATAAIVAASGLAIFAFVTPAIEPSSWVAISLDALGVHQPSADAVFLTYDEPRHPKPGEPWNLRWLYVEPMARLLPARPAATRTVGEFARAAAASPEPPEHVYLWSPALEADAAISRSMCERWPGAALYTLRDRPRIFRAYAADPRGGAWQPRLPADRWSVAHCPALPAP
jgi:hypothetical protein